MIIFTWFDPGMIDLNRTSARAVKDLKHFLEFVDRGPTALAEAVHGSLGGHESPSRRQSPPRCQQRIGLSCRRLASPAPA